jgi:hypothetical protein
MAMVSLFLSKVPSLLGEEIVIALIKMSNDKVQMSNQMRSKAKNDFFELWHLPACRQGF